MESKNTHAEEAHWIDHLDVLRTRWRTIVATFVGFVTVAAVVNYRLPPVYRSTARLVIGVASPAGMLADRSSPIEGYLLERRSFETELEVMRSEPVARRAAVALGWLAEDAAPAQAEPVIATIKGAVAVEHLRDTRIVLLHAYDRSADRARDLANAMADAYIAHSTEQRDDARRRSINWLTEELAAQRDKLKSAEEKLVDYASQERLDLAREETSATTTASDAADEALRAELASAEVELSQLRRRYLGEHPKLVESELRVQSLRARLAQSQGTRSEEHRKLIQYRILRRDADLDHEMYEVLLKKLKQADIQAGVADLDMQVLEAAKRPGAPIEPRAVRNLAVASLLGLCIAIGLAFVVDLLDRSVGSPEEVARALALPTLGVVGRFEGRGRPSSLVTEGPGGLEGEMFRALRTNLRFSHVDMPRRVVLVTSTGPEEGKSTVLANLAVSLAQSGRKTLVIDTDLRRPSLHRIFALPKSRGLADLLAGDASLDAALRPTHVDGLVALPCGTLPANPAELIESARLQDLLRELRSRFDYVLLDSPPAGGLIDASLLASLADGVLLVVEPRRFDWRVLRSTVRQLERSGARLYGVVLNKAPRDERSDLYRYYGYGADESTESDRGPRGGGPRGPGRPRGPGVATAGAR